MTLIGKENLFGQMEHHLIILILAEESQTTFEDEKIALIFSLITIHRENQLGMMELVIIKQNLFAKKITPLQEIIEEQRSVMKTGVFGGEKTGQLQYDRRKA